ncbi:Siderophore exporter MmpL4 [Myxococcaceae bacterium]|nr:Siderophore exporter MmpL4 [Myxococcaceae bacterium]
MRARAGGLLDASIPTLPVLPFTVGAALCLGAGFAVAALRPGSVVRHPGIVLALVACVSLAAVAALVRLDPPGLRITIDPSTEPMLPTGDPAEQVYREAVRDFGDDEIYVIAMHSEDVFTPENLRRIRRVSERIERLDGVRAVESLASVTSMRWSPEFEWIEVKPFLDEVPDDPAALAELRSRAVADPLYRKSVVSSDGATAALNVAFRKMSDGELIASDLDSRIAAILDEESAPGVAFHVAGRPHLKHHVYHTMARDLRVLIPLAILLMAGLLGFSTGSVRGVVLPLGSVLVAVLWTFAALSLLGRPLTILTTLLGPNLIVVGSVYGVHVLARHEEEVETIRDCRSAARTTLEHVLLPVTVSGVTTIIGYGSLLLTDVPSVFDYGAFSVLGVAIVTLLSLTLVPAALACLPLPRRTAARRGERPRPRITRGIEASVDRILEATSRLSRHRSTAVIAISCVFGLVAVLLLPRVVVDTDTLSYFDESAPVRVDFAAVNRLLAGAVPLFLVVDGPGPGAFRDPVALRTLEAVEARLRALPGVTHTSSLVGPLRAMNRVLEEDDPAAERVPESRQAVAELLHLLPKADLGRLATPDQAKTNLVVRTGEVGSAAILRLASEIESTASAERFAPGTRIAVTGNAILLGRSADSIARGQAGSVGLAALTILVLLTALLGSGKLGLVAMAPNALPVLLFFGLLGAGVAPLSLPTSLIASVALGIAIDDTVHYLVRYRDERAAGRTPDEAVAITSRRVGRPMLVAALMLILGFLGVALSGFATLREFGLLSAATMAICLATDLVLLPALLVRSRA